jgi:hypothetical protein
MRGRTILIGALLAASCDSEVPEPEARDLLSTAGLYSDLATQALAPGVREYAPQFELWSDGSEKRRWLRLPADGVIDTSDPDRWVFPIGTKIFKEFSRGGRNLETRMIERTGEGDRDYRMVAYVWRADGSDAEPMLDGYTDVLGTGHDVPKERECWDCHAGERGRVLGISALQLPWESSMLSLVELAEQGRLSSLPSAKFHLPGTSSIAAVLGYLHANCGTCHNPLGAAWEDTKLELRVRTTDQTPEETAIYATTIEVGIQSWRTEEYELNVVPGEPERSALIARMLRLDADRMPPIATETLDVSGIELIRTWILSLEP